MTLHGPADVQAPSLTDEDGFSTAETIVAIFIASFVLLAVMGSLLGATKGTLTARQNQQSAELVSRKIEALRAFPVADLANRDADVAGKPMVTGTTGARGFDPDAGGPLASESVLLSVTGRIATHRETVVVNGTSYTTAVLVTKPKTAAGVVDNSGDYRRVTVVATWRKPGGTSAERRTSTFVTNTRRGLPLPQFQWGAPSVKAVTAGAQLVLPAVLTNIGARDEWRLVVTSNPTTALSWTWYVDGDRDGVLDSNETLTLPTANADGSWLTGPIATDETKHVLAVTTVPAGTANGLRYITSRATSVAQPSLDSASKAFRSEVTVVGGVGLAPAPGPEPVYTPPNPDGTPASGGTPGASPSPAPSGTTPTTSPTTAPTAGPTPTSSSTPQGPVPAVGSGCAGCNSRTLSLLNQPLPGPGGPINNQASSSYLDPMPVSQSAPIATTLSNYCGGDCTLGGRFLAKGGSATDSDVKKFAQWRYQLPNAMTLEKVNISVFAAPRGRAADKKLGLTAVVFHVAGSSTPVALATVTNLPTTNHGSAFAPITVQVPFTSRNFSNNDFLVVRVLGTGDDDLDLAYATTSYVSAMTIHGKSGL